MTILATLALAAMSGIQNPNIADNIGQVVSGSHSTVSYGIDAGTDPMQKNTQPFKTRIPVPGGSATLSSEYSYTINARVESAKAYDDTISDLVPYDLLLAWGDMATDDVGSKLTWEQGNSKGQVSGLLGEAGVKLSTDYGLRQGRSNRLIASTAQIEGAPVSTRAGAAVGSDG